MFAGSLVEKLQSSPVTEPRQPALDDPTKDAQPTRRSVRPISQGHDWLISRPTAAAGNHRHRIERWDRALRTMHAGRTGRHDQRNALSDFPWDVPFAPSFRLIRGVWAGVRPTTTARTLALSMTSSEASSRPRLSRHPRSFSWTCGQNPRFVQSRSRRQQVTPESQPSSAGRNHQSMPICSTHTMPISQARSLLRNTGRVTDT